VPAAFAVFVLAGGAFRESVVYGANFGRDADTLASIAGAIAGAYGGARAIPADWIEQIEAGNPVKQRTLAEGLYHAVLREVETARRRLEEITALA
jgi:ADP-ribosylglycohydrolase